MQRASSSCSQHPSFTRAPLGLAPAETTSAGMSAVLRDNFHRLHSEESPWWIFTSCFLSSLVAATFPILSFPPLWMGSSKPMTCPRVAVVESGLSPFYCVKSRENMVCIRTCNLHLLLSSVELELQPQKAEQKWRKQEKVLWLKYSSYPKSDVDWHGRPFVILASYCVSP